MGTLGKMSGLDGTNGTNGHVRGHAVADGEGVEDSGRDEGDTSGAESLPRELVVTVGARIAREVKKRPLEVVVAAFAGGLLVGGALRSTTARMALFSLASRFLQKTMGLG